MIKTRKYILVVLAAALLLPDIGFTAGTSWTALNPGAPSALFGIAWSDQLHLFATVGTGGKILTGDGCGPWTAQNSGTTKDLYSVTWGGGQFVAVGAGSTILTSPDGATWTPHPVAVTTELWGVVWNGNTYVIVGNLGTIFTSSTGLSWSAQSSSTNNALMDVIWDGVKFVAVGDNGTILNSPDGVTWSAVSVPVGTGNWIRGIAWNGPKYVAVGNDATGGNALILTSPNGASWTVVPATSSWPKLGGIIWGDNKFVAVGKGGTILTSPFGNSWTQQASNTTDFLMDVAWNGCMFAAVGGASATGPAIILTSSNGSCCSATTPACAPPPPNMVTWWDADAVNGTTATDIQGSNNGALMNGVATVPGKVGTSFKFDGSNYMVANNPIINGFQQLTIDMWVKPSSNFNQSQQAIAGIQTFHAMPTDATGFFTKQGTPGKALVFRVNTASGVAATSGKGAFGVPPDQWTHVAGTYDGNTVKLYVNGMLVPNTGGNIGSTATTASNQPLQGPVQLVSSPNLNFVLASSYWNGLPSYPFFGEIDEVEIFDRALSASEIQAIYNADSLGKCKTTTSCVAPPNHMVSWWDADAVNGMTATDIQDSNDGTLMNGATTTTFGKVGKAFKFDGAKDYVQVGSPVVNTPPFSVDAWVKPSSIPPSVSHNYNKYIVANGGETKSGFGLALLIEEQQWVFSIADASGFRGFAGVNISAPVWTHVAGTWDGSTNPGSIKLYVDGVLAATGTPTATSSIGTAKNLRIGAPTKVVKYLWDGLIDEVEIFDHVLTPFAIKDIYSAGAAGKCKTNHGKICGHKFNDLNGNGTWDQLLEPGLQGWTITAIDPSGQSAGTATTDANGQYCIAVPASTAPYTVTEDIQSQGGNWMQTAPAAPGTYSVSVAVGQTVNNINFGNRKKNHAQPNIKIQKTAVNAPWQVGGTGTYQLVLTNTGGVLASGSIVVDEGNFPSPPMTLMGFGGSGWNCSGLACEYVGSYPIAAGASLPPITVEVEIEATSRQVVYESDAPFFRIWSSCCLCDFRLMLC